MMLSADFYKKFTQYKFILIHQLDAYVFKDDLLYWCSRNFDYIGAPHPQHTNQHGDIQFLKSYTKFIKTINNAFGTSLTVSNAGNGGLSLRKTAKCYWLVKLLRGKVNKWGKNNEDGFFKYWGNLLNPFFRLPNDKTALRFSIEQLPADALVQLDNQLPFGCHAFEKYEPETWARYIPGLAFTKTNNTEH